MSVRDSLDVAGDRLRGALGGMAPRERFLVAFTLLVLVCFVGYFSAGAMNRNTKRVQSNISLAAQAQARVDNLVAEYSQLSSEAESLDARLAAGKDFAVLTWLETIGNEMGIQANIRSVTERGLEETDYYKAQKIDLIVDDLDLRQLVDLMYRRKIELKLFRQQRHWTKKAMKRDNVKGVTWREVRAQHMLRQTRLAVVRQAPGGAGRRVSRPPLAC